MFSSRAGIETKIGEIDIGPSEGDSRVAYLNFVGIVPFALRKGVSRNEHALLLEKRMNALAAEKEKLNAAQGAGKNGEAEISKLQERHLDAYVELFHLKQSLSNYPAAPSKPSGQKLLGYRGKKLGKLLLAFGEEIAAKEGKKTIEAELDKRTLGRDPEKHGWEIIEDRKFANSYYRKKIA